MTYGFVVSGQQDWRTRFGPPTEAELELEVQELEDISNEARRNYQVDPRHGPQKVFRGLYRPQEVRVLMNLHGAESLTATGVVEPVKVEGPKVEVKPGKRPYVSKGKSVWSPKKLEAASRKRKDIRHGRDV